MREFGTYVREQIAMHPSMQPRDVVKLCYQAAFGAEHLLADQKRARAYFDEEYDKVDENNIPLYEEISQDVCRVNLAAWKKSGMPSEWLFRMFVGTASVPQGSKTLFLQYLERAEQILKTADTSFEESEWKTYLLEYKESGMPSVHHSQVYREKEHPSYRIVNRRFIDVLPILQKAAQIQQDGIRVIAIDGRAAAGKSTAAEMLGKILDADIVQMDDFFLPPSLRTEERLSEAGGNVHYERFKEEVMPYLKTSREFSYRCFDCYRMDYHGEQSVKTLLWRLVEGSYSQHPVLGNYADLKVFMDVEPKEQMRRIICRNGNEMAAMFHDRWIPMEENYFEHYQIRNGADLVLKLG